MAPSQIYYIDTSYILHWFIDTYPPAIFPGVQTRVENLVALERLCAPKTVFDEVGRVTSAMFGAKRGQRCF